MEILPKLRPERAPHEADTGHRKKDVCSAWGDPSGRMISASDVPGVPPRAGMSRPFRTWEVEDHRSSPLKMPFPLPLVHARRGKWWSSDMQETGWSQRNCFWKATTKFCRLACNRSSR